MPQDQYIPAKPDAAVCPYPEHEFAESPQQQAWAELVMFRACCPNCGGRWHEMRVEATVERFSNYRAAEGAHPGCRGAYLREEAPSP